MSDDNDPPIDSYEANVTPITSAKRRRKSRPVVQDNITELTLCERLLSTFGEDLRYCAELGGWHRWTGTHWKRDEAHAHECVKAIAQELATEASALLDPDLFKAATRAGSSRGMRAILDLAWSTPGTVFEPGDADRDPWLLNVLNGTLDLRTGQLRSHQRADLITHVVPVAYDPHAKAPAFERFLAEVQPDAEVRAYLARAFGYASIGVVREHVLLVLWGPGANGKSVLAECISRALGDYARPGPSSLIVASNEHSTDVAGCAGVRLVVVHETKRGANFDSSKVKLLTGGDKLTARHMREDFFDFVPSHTLVMLSNYKPGADGSDAALWRRVQLVPFETIIPLERQDRDLAQRIIDRELPGVLRWIVEGATEWQRVGLSPPAIVLEQTAAYRAAEDVVEQFLAERCDRLPGLTQRAGPLYAAFKNWCEGQGIRPVRSNDFAAEVCQRPGIDKRKDNRGAIYTGLQLSAEESHGYHDQ